MKLKKTIPQFGAGYIPFLLIVFFILNSCVQHFPLIPFQDALIIAAVYFFSTVLLLTVFFFLFNTITKAALYSFILLCIQFFFGWFHDILKNLFPGSLFSRYAFVIPFTFFSIIIFFLLIKRTKTISGKVIRYLNITLIILILVDAGMLTIKTAKHTTSVSPQTFLPCNNCAKPNIYLILADEYAGKESLKELFSFDNSSFENELKKRGFFVSNAATSNYNFTPYSMASLFSMNYLRGITAKSNDRNNLNLCFQNINNNELARILKKMNYGFVNLSLFDFAGEPTIRNYNNFYSSRAELISTQTLTGRIKKDLIFHLAFTLKWQWAYKNYLNNLRDDLEYQYKTTVEQSMDTGKPRFIYTHFIMPHYPYLYNKEGNPLPVEPALNGGKKEYLGFLQYCNKRLLSLIDTIQKNDRTGPTIILMSDHGFTKYDSRETDSSYNFKNIFNIYIPDRNYSSFSDTISNVNVFRILLNSRFNQRLPLLKDSSFFLTEY